MFELTPEQLQQLDTNIKNMLGAGATQSEVEKYASDFKSKFGKKKSGETDSQSSSNGSSLTKLSGENNSQPQSIFGNQFNDLGQPQIAQPNGAVLAIDPKTIPVTPLADQSGYVTGLQERLKTNKLTPQDNQVIYKNTNPISTFNSNDDAELQRLSELNKLSTENISALKIPSSISAFIPEFENKSIGEVLDSPEAKYTQALQLQGNIISEIDRLSVSANPKAPKSAEEKQKIAEKKKELDQAQLLIKKLSTQLADKGEQSVEATIRTDESGNQFSKTATRLQLLLPGGTAEGQLKISQETVDRVEQLPSSFVTGLNYYKYAEPVMFERLSKSLQTGEPISESQVAQVTAQGLSIEENRLKDKYNQQAITKDEYVNGMRDIQVGRSENLLGNKETLRAFLSSGIAELADETNTTISSTLPVSELGSKVFGHRWNYDDSEIELYGKAYAKANGLDPNDARVVGAIKYLQDNEGAMLLENSIAKAGWARDLAKGLAQPIRGIVSSIEDTGKKGAEVYAESQSQGNVNASEKRLKRIDNSWEGTVSAVMEGAGQFITQAGLAAATSGLLGAAAEGLIGARAATGIAEAGVASDEAAIAGNSIGAGVDLGSASVAESLGKRLLATKDFTSTLITSYAQSYDNNLKTALSYTSDDSTAKKVAGGMSLLEGLTENILSPLEVSQGIIKKVFKSKNATEGVLGILSDANILDKQSAISTLLKNTLKGGLETAKVVGSEILEEEVTQVADYAANAILNPNSESFQNRDLQNEILNTANQTGLSMVLPALLSGVGAANTNNFSKGTLLIAAQNRQHLLDDMNKRLFYGDLTQDEYNAKTTIINTAAKANETLPAKANGVKLNSQEKADYVYSRVAEGVLNKRLSESEDAAEKNILEAKIKEQQDFRIKLLQNEDQNINTATEGENAESQDAKSTTTEAATNESSKNQLKSAEELLLPHINNPLFTGLTTDDEKLRMVAAQAQNVSDIETGTPLSGNVDARPSMEKAFGKELVDAAVAKFPVTVIENTVDEVKDISVGEMLDKTGTYKGQKGSFYQDGQSVIFKLEGRDKEYDLGNIDEIKDAPISDFDISHETSVVDISDDGNIVVRGKEYTAENYSNPLAAVNWDKDGNFVSVNLETTDGKKVTFRGNIGEDVAYQIHLKEINKNNETRTEFEQYLNEDSAASAEMDNGTVLENVQEKPVENNEPVPREKIVKKVEEDIQGARKVDLDRADAKKVYQEVRQLDEPTDARGLALSYLAHGGKVGEDAINEVSGSVKRASLNTGAMELKSNEVRGRDYSDKNGDSIDDIVHSIWDNLPENLQDAIDIQDIKNELQGVINNHDTRLSAAKEYLSSYGIEEPVFASEEEISDEEQKLNDYLNSESELPYEPEYISDNEILNIINNETGNEEENKQPSTKSKSGSGKANSPNSSKKKSKESAEVSKISDKIRSFAASIRKNGITPDFLKIDDTNAKTQGLSSKQVDDFIATTIEKVADLIDGGTAIADAIKQGIADIKDLYDKNNVPVDEAKLTTWFTDLINNQNTDIEEDVSEIAKKIKADEISYIDAVDGKSQDFIDALDEALKGKRAYTFNEEGFRSNVRRQKEYGISKEDVIEGYEAVKKLTKRQKELIDEVFGETADTDKEAADLQEAFRQLAKGEKPKKVLKRLGASDVTNLVQALSNALSYKAISNIQLEAMADYIVDSIDLKKSEDYLNAMINNSMVDVKQLVRAKLIVKLQEDGNDELATKLVEQMADDAVSSGRATQSLIKAYEILGAKGNPKVRTAFAKKYAESVQQKALKMNQRMSEIISEKEAEIGRLNQRIHNESQKSSAVTKLKDIIANLCGLRNKK